MPKRASHDQVIILGAARALRSDLPPALVSVDENGRVMDWLLSAFSVLKDSKIYFVSGYKATEIQHRYPQISLTYNPDWESTGPAGSLAVVPLCFTSPTWIAYSDVVFRPDTIQKLASLEADLVLAIDRTWRDRYAGRSRSELNQAEKVILDGEGIQRIGRGVNIAEAQAEFVGVMRLSGAATRKLDGLLRSGRLSKRAALPEIVTCLVEEGLRTAVSDVRGDWAELNAPQDLSHFVLGTKAESLARIKTLLRSGVVGDLVSVDHQQWKHDPAQVLGEIHQTLGEGQLIVRSSALSEDRWDASSAGVYKSVANVKGSSPNTIAAAIKDVFSSYGSFHARNQVLVQQMLSDIECSGVVMTRTPSVGAPYSVISFDDKSRRTDTVTTGSGDTVRSVFLHRDHELCGDLPKSIHRLKTVVDELEQLVGYDSLDIEFACTTDEVVHILQVRPLALPRLDYSVDDGCLAVAIEEGKGFFRALQQTLPFVVGKSTQLSVMSDWNPAEIIGTKPRQLALSLYRYIVTDETWATQRAEYGYRDVRPCNLMVNVLGHPYIDVRATFNSFIPSELGDEAATRLVNHYLDYLQQNPELHDKVEFSVLFTSLTFDFDTKAKSRLNGVLTEAEIEDLWYGLLRITQDAMDRCGKDFEQIGDIQTRFERIMAANLPPMERAYVLLEDLRRVDTLRFAHLARSAFVAASLLRSLPSTGVVTESCEVDFVATLDTVSGVLKRDARATAGGKMAWEDFVGKYGHLRPGTYDITSPRYDTEPDLFLRPMLDHADLDEPVVQSDGKWDDRTRAAISTQLEELGLDEDVGGFERFLAQAIKGRELCKFVFTRKLSAALEALAEFGENHGVSRDQLAHVAINDLFKCRLASTGNIRETLTRLSSEGAETFRVTEALCLPGQIFSTADFGCFEQSKATPNFVTSRMVRAPIVVLSGSSPPAMEVEGHIVVVTNADPGFDWLFSRNIKGLITMYGGGNSHMAIRAAEFKLPAAIGVGESLFEKLAQAEIVELDCASRQIRVAD